MSVLNLKSAIADTQPPIKIGNQPSPIIAQEIEDGVRTQ